MYEAEGVVLSILGLVAAVLRGWMMFGKATFHPFAGTGALASSFGLFVCARLVELDHRWTVQLIVAGTSLVMVMLTYQCWTGRQATQTL